MKTGLSATMRSVLIVGTTLSVVLGLLFLLFRILQPFLFIFLTAFILSVFLNPLFAYMHQKLRLPKTISATLAIFVSILVVSIPLSIIVTLLVSETGDVLAFIQANAGTRNELTQAVYGYLNQWGISTQNFEFEVNKYIVTSLRFVSTSLTAILSQAFGFILNGFLTLLVTFYFLMHKETIIHYVTSINLLSQADTERLASRATEVMTATIRGNFIVIAIQAVLGGVGFAIFGLSSPVLLGALYGLASLIPVVGITLVWLPTAAYLMLSGNLVGGIGLVVWCIGSNLLMDNVVGPKIVAGETKLHPLFILFGVLGGIQLFGLFGIILGPTIIALSFVALEMYRQLLKE
ncbi:AI-2E family transporter [Patescibacteria group bacterium]|nr:AI-2E family transporter [Patescibacteria group bacterium]